MARTKIRANISCFKDYSGPGWSGKFCSQQCTIENRNRTDEKMRQVQRDNPHPVPSFVPRKQP